MKLHRDGKDVPGGEKADDDEKQGDVHLAKCLPYHVYEGKENCSSVAT